MCVPYFPLQEPFPLFRKRHRTHSCYRTVNSGGEGEFKGSLFFKEKILGNQYLWDNPIWRKGVAAQVYLPEYMVDSLFVGWPDGCGIRKGTVEASNYVIPAICHDFSISLVQAAVGLETKSFGLFLPFLCSFDGIRSCTMMCILCVCIVAVIIILQFSQLICV